MRSLWRRLETGSSSTLRTEVAETGMPRPLSSPTIRLYPQCGFSLASRRLSSRSERVSGGRPGNRCEYVHRRAMSWRCQRSSVSGVNGKAAQAARGSERLSAASSARSACVRRGLEGCRRRIASSWRRTRISNSFERRGTSAEPTEPDAPERRERVCEPYVDGEGIVSTVVYGPDRRTRITPETREVLFAVYAPAGVGESSVRDHLADIRANVLLVAPEAETGPLVTQVAS
jgi:hypothetical protein